MFNGEQFNSYFEELFLRGKVSNADRCDMEKLKYDLLNIEEKEILGFSEVDTYKLRCFFGIDIKNKKVSNLEVYEYLGVPQRLVILDSCNINGVKIRASFENQAKQKKITKEF